MGPSGRTPYTAANECIIYIFAQAVQCNVIKTNCVVLAEVLPLTADQAHTRPCVLRALYPSNLALRTVQQNRSGISSFHSFGYSRIVRRSCYVRSALIPVASLMPGCFLEYFDARNSGRTQTNLKKCRNHSESTELHVNKCERAHGTDGHVDGLGALAGKSYLLNYFFSLSELRISSR